MSARLTAWARCSSTARMRPARRSDWDDEKSIAILENVRKAIRPDGRVLIMEAIIDPQSGAGAPGK